MIKRFHFFSPWSPSAPHCHWIPLDTLTPWPWCGETHQVPRPNLNIGLFLSHPPIRKLEILWALHMQISLFVTIVNNSKTCPCLMLSWVKLSTKISKLRPPLMLCLLFPTRVKSRVDPSIDTWILAQQSSLWVNCGNLTSNSTKGYLRAKCW
jgi:hypothetical protein